MKCVDVLTVAEQIEKDVLVVSYPTDNTNGIGLRLKGDPVIEIFTFDWVKKNRSDFVIKDGFKKKFGRIVNSHLTVSIPDANLLSDKIKILINKEV
jgi:hypothetical protein